MAESLDAVLLGVLVGIATLLMLLLLCCAVWLWKYRYKKHKRVIPVEKKEIHLPVFRPSTTISQITRQDPRRETGRRSSKKRSRRETGERKHDDKSGSSTPTPRGESKSRSTSPSTASIPGSEYWNKRRQLSRSESMITSAVIPAVSARLTSSFGDPPPARSVRGAIQYALRYVVKRSLLVVTVIRGNNLLAVPHVSTDSYVKVYILPDWQDIRRKTAVVTNDRHPNFNETFKFHREIKELEDSELLFRAFNKDKLARNYFLGEIRLRLSGYGFQGLDIAEWRNLESLAELRMGGSSVEIVVAMKYNLGLSSLTVTVHKVLQNGDVETRSITDGYVSCCFYLDRVFQEKDMTQRVQSSGTVIFNYTFSFDVAFAKARGSSLLLQLKDSSRPRPERVLGRVVLGCAGETDAARQHVNRALDAPDAEILHSYRLSCEL